jgi:DNA mismatch repair protein MutL
MSKIRVLPDALANQIAAGEVVERPASVIKELLENSLDAGARQIEIEVESGGKRLMRIRDDGEGMTPDDAMLAFERHATSKLTRSDDLMEIATLGFRGEALPSIASVARVVLETRHDSAPVGSMVEIHGAKLISVKETALPRGTTISVRDLFFNVPARKKFLKSESTELGHLVTSVTQYALAHPEISFLLKSAGSELFRFQAVGSLEERIFQVFGEELLKGLIPLDQQLPVYYQDEEAGEPQGEKGWIRLRGFVSQPSIQKLNRNSISFFVNRRLVRDRILQHALSEAYRNILPPTMFPVVLVFLEMPYREVDVNVHPSKTEVRFRHQALLHDFLRDSVRKTLLDSRPQAPFPIRPATVEGRAVPPGSLDYAGPENGVSPSGTELLALTPPPLLATPGQLPFQADETLYITSHDGFPVPGNASPDASAPVPREARFPVSEEGILPLGQLENSFILADDHGALLIIDQHVAHERILFETVLDQRTRGKVESQRLLLPIIAELSPRQQVILEQITPELTACGFEVEPFGRKTIAIKAAPAGLATADVQVLLNELLEGLEKETQEITLTRLREKIAASIACHAAIKINTRLDTTKMRWLIDEWQKTRCPMSCPHGRPIVLRYEKNEILRAFKRI